MLVIWSPRAFDFQPWESSSEVGLPFNIVPAGYAEMEHVLDRDPVVPHVAYKEVKTEPSSVHYGKVVQS